MSTTTPEYNGVVPPPPGAAPSLISDAASGGGYPPPNPAPAAGLGGGGSTPAGTPTAQGNLMQVQTLDQLKAQAAAQVNDQLNGQINPLQAQYNLLGSQEAGALQGIGQLFGTLLPSVAQSAQGVKDAYDQAQASEQAIFAQAQVNMNAMKQSAAQRAQALAQEMGGPVAITDFTDPYAAGQPALANLGAGQLLHTLGYAQAGEQAAQAFAGQVFPLIQTEQEAQARKTYEDKKTSIQDQITQLKQQAAGQIDAKLSDLVQQERTFALQKNQQTLDAAKAKADTAATKQTLKNDEARIALARQQFALQTKQEGFNEKTTTTKLSQQDKQFASQLGLSYAQLNQRKTQLAAQTKLANKQLAAAKQVQANGYLDAALSPQPGKTVTVTQKVPVDPVQAYKDHQAFRDGGTDAHPKYSKLVKVQQTMTNQPITDPGSLVDFLTAHGVGKKAAIAMVKQRLRIPNWSYGEANPYDTSTAPYTGKH